MRRLSLWREAQILAHIYLADVSIWRNLERIDNTVSITELASILKAGTE